MKLYSAGFLLVLVCISSSSGVNCCTNCKDGCSNIQSSLGNLFSERPQVFSITEFGGVSDGVTLNTKAFQKGVDHIRNFENFGGATLFVPKGVWLTGCFNLTSHMTLFLDHGAVILASEDPEDWPVVDPLPSYGRGRELPGKRYASLLQGHGIVDVAIKGNNGTFDGQGLVWWTRFKSKTLNYTRGHMVEFMYSSNILLSNVTFINPPFWTVHPVYSSNVLIQQVTVLAPHRSPNTDAFDPDSSSDVCIQDCYIDNGDDAVAVKSGWDEYGLKFNRPSHDIFIRNLTVRGSHGISLGSEMSGGIYNVHVQDISISEAVQAIHVKTSAGRGAYIVNATFNNFQIFNTGVAFSFTGIYGDHPDSHYNASLYATIENISISNINGSKVNRAGDFRGVYQSPFRHICFSNITLQVEAKKTWNCSYIEGYSTEVYPEPCSALESEHSCWSTALTSCAPKKS